MKKKKRRGLKIALLMFLAIFLFSTGMGYAYVKNLLDSTIQEDIPTTDKELGIGDKEFEFEDTNVNFPGKGEEDEDDDRREKLQ